MTSHKGRQWLLTASLHSLRHLRAIGREYDAGLTTNFAQQSGRNTADFQPRVNNPVVLHQMRKLLRLIQHSIDMLRRQILSLPPRGMKESFWHSEIFR